MLTAMVRFILMSLKKLQKIKNEQSTQCILHFFHSWVPYAEDVIHMGEYDFNVLNDNGL